MGEEKKQNTHGEEKPTESSEVVEEYVGEEVGGKIPLSNLEKVAILVVVLGREVAIELFKYLGQRELERLVYAISQLGYISPEQRSQVIFEFYELLSQELPEGGMYFTRSVLQQAFGEQRSNTLLSEALASHGGNRPFEYLLDLDSISVASFIQEEHPQTIALVLVSLPSEKAAPILGELPSHVQASVAKRIAVMDKTNPDFLLKVDQVLEERLSKISLDSYKLLGGIEDIVGILNLSDRKTERAIMDSLEKSDPELAENIKKRMFTFEDIVLLDDRSVQRVIREVSPQDFAKALKGVEQEAVKEKIFKNTSKRVREMLQDEISFLGPTRRREVEEIQQKIVMIMRRLEEQGEILIARGGQDETFI